MFRNLSEGFEENSRKDPKKREILKALLLSDEPLKVMKRFLLSTTFRVPRFGR